MKNVLTLVAATVVLGSGCDGDREIVSEEFQDATAHSWFEPGAIVTELRDADDALLATAAWDIGAAAGAVEVDEQSVPVEVSGVELTRELANRLTYQQWSAQVAFSYGGGPIWMDPETGGGGGGGGDTCSTGGPSCFCSNGSHCCWFATVCYRTNADGSRTKTSEKSWLECGPLGSC